MSQSDKKRRNCSVFSVIFNVLKLYRLLDGKNIVLQFIISLIVI